MCDNGYWGNSGWPCSPPMNPYCRPPPFTPICEPPPPPPPVRVSETIAVQTCLAGIITPVAGAQLAVPLNIWATTASTGLPAGCPLIVAAQMIVSAGATVPADLVINSFQVTLQTPYLCGMTFTGSAVILALTATPPASCVQILTTLTPTRACDTTTLLTLTPTTTLLVKNLLALTLVATQSC